MRKIAGKIAVLSAAALIGAGLLTPSAAEARGGGALAAGIIGGLAAGALIGAAVSDARPVYGYPAPAYAYGPPPVSDRPAGYGYGYGPVYDARRPVAYGYDGPGYGDWRRHYARSHGYGGW